MPITETTFIGITPTSGKSSFTYAVLDKDLRLLALADGDLDDLIAFVSAQSSVTVAVNAPASVNHGVVRESSKREKLTPNQVSRTNLRLAEHELRRRGITVSKTPASAAASPAWMQAGFALYRALEKSGFKKYPADGAAYQMLESQPHAAFCVMTGAVPQPKNSLEGLIQRQLVLFEAGMRIKDPMDFFEEITRYKMVKGIFPMELLYLPDQLDSLVAAYTAWLATVKPDRVSALGEISEGMIVLPEKELKQKY